MLVCAVSGMITAARKRMDIVGTYCLAIVTAFGGGTLRDLLIDRRPFFWVSHDQYLLIIVALCVAFVYSRSFHARASRWHRQGVIVDAMGLALFTLTGVGFALDKGLPLFVASLIGVITGTFGGVLRDVVAMEIPVLFRPGELYAVSSFAGAWVYIGGLHSRAFPAVVVRRPSPSLTIVGLRLVSHAFGVKVPDPLWLRRSAGDVGDGRPRAAPRSGIVTGRRLARPALRPDQRFHDAQPLHVVERLAAPSSSAYSRVTSSRHRTRASCLRHHRERAVEVGELVAPAAEDRRVLAVDVAVGIRAPRRRRPCTGRRRRSGRRRAASRGPRARRRDCPRPR